MNNHEPIITYYANAKLFSRRIRRRPIRHCKQPWVLVKHTLDEEEDKIYLDTISNLKCTIKHLLAYKNTSEEYSFETKKLEELEYKFLLMNLREDNLKKMSGNKKELEKLKQETLKLYKYNKKKKQEINNLEYQKNESYDFYLRNYTSLKEKFKDNVFKIGKLEELIEILEKEKIPFTVILEQDKNLITNDYLIYIQEQILKALSNYFDYIDNKIFQLKKTKYGIKIDIPLNLNKSTNDRQSENILSNDDNLGLPSEFYEDICLKFTKESRFGYIFQEEEDFADITRLIEFTIGYMQKYKIINKLYELEIEKLRRYIGKIDALEMYLNNLKLQYGNENNIFKKLKYKNKKLEFYDDILKFKSTTLSNQKEKIIDIEIEKNKIYNLYFDNFNALKTKLKTKILKIERLEEIKKIFDGYNIPLSSILEQNYKFISNELILSMQDQILNSLTIYPNDNVEFEFTEYNDEKQKNHIAK